MTTEERIFVPIHDLPPYERLECALVAGVTGDMLKDLILFGRPVEEEIAPGVITTPGRIMSQPEHQKHLHRRRVTQELGDFLLRRFTDTFRGH